MTCKGPLGGETQAFCTMAVRGHVETREGNIIHVQTKVAVPLPLRKFGVGIARHRIHTHIAEILGHTIERSCLSVFDHQATFKCWKTDLRGLVFCFSYGGLWDFLSRAKADGDLHLALEKIFQTLEHVCVHNHARERKWCRVCATDVAVLVAEQEGRLIRLYDNPI